MIDGDAWNLHGDTFINRHLTRRRALLGGVGIVACAITKVQPAKATSTAVIDVTSSPYNASPSLSDNSNAFQAALNALLALGGGELIVPPGFYKLASPLTWNSTGSGIGAPISIIGSGRSASILVIQHTSTAIAFTFSYAGDSANVLVRDLGFSCVPSGNQGGTCLAITFPVVTSSAWQACLIEHVDFGVQAAGYSTFSTALMLTNIFNSEINDCSFHGGFTGGAGGTFASFNGKCVDNRFTNCTVTNVGVGYAVNSYCEGLHIVDNVVLTSIGVTTGAVNSNYNSGVNLLGLYISGGEFNASSQALSLVQVFTGWLTGTHFGVTNGTTTCAFAGCAKMTVQGCTFSGSNASNSVGLALVSNPGGYPSGWASSNAIDNCQFQYLTTSILFGATTQYSNGVASNSATNMRVLDAGGNIVNVSTVVDMNGASSTNQAQWVTTLPGASRFGYLR